jgi:hypothetical protein
MIHPYTHISFNVVKFHNIYIKIKHKKSNKLSNVKFELENFQIAIKIRFFKEIQEASLKGFLPSNPLQVD